MPLIKSQKISDLTEKQKKDRVAPLIRIDSRCTCKEDCIFDCKGECGCESCKERYSDFLSRIEV